MTFSKSPILEEVFYDFPVSNQGNIIEDIGAKGVLITTIETKGRILYVFNTHLYSGEGIKAERIRLEQLKFIQALIKNYSQDQSRNIILAGDLNFEHPEIIDKHELNNQWCYSYTTNNMRLLDSRPNITEEDCTINPILNPYTTKANRIKNLDYVFYKNSDKLNFIISNKRTIIKDQYSLSDHLGIQIDFKPFGKNSCKDL